MSYTVCFKGTGYTKPDERNPKGIRVTATGTVRVRGKRPASNMDIPTAVVAHCKMVFMQQCQIVRMAKDTPNIKHYPTVWLPKL